MVERVLDAILARVAMGLLVVKLSPVSRWPGVLLRLVWDCPSLEGMSSVAARMRRRKWQGHPGIAEDAWRDVEFTTRGWERFVLSIYVDAQLQQREVVMKRADREGVRSRMADTLGVLTEPDRRIDLCLTQLLSPEPA